MPSASWPRIHTRLAALARVTHLRLVPVAINCELPLMMVEVTSWVVVRVRETHPVGKVRVPPGGECHAALEGCGALVVQVPVQRRHDAVEPSEHLPRCQRSPSRPGTPVIDVVERSRVGVEQRREPALDWGWQSAHYLEEGSYVSSDQVVPVALAGGPFWG